jgi:hypothetical protein
VKQILDHIIQIGDNDTMNMVALTHKTAMLMALVSACRGSELQAADIGAFVDSGDKLEFKIGKLTKSKRPNKPHFSLVFRQYMEVPELDVINTIRTYMNRTEHWRGLKTNKPKLQLFLATIKPHNPVATCTIARWLKLLLAECGVDT